LSSFLITPEAGDRTGLCVAGASSVPVVVIERRSGWRLIDWKEVYQYRDLFRFLVWREVKVRYAQSAVGIGWALIQPLSSMVIFTIVFGRLANVSSDGAPYSLFALAALVPWTYFTNALTDGASSLVNNSSMLSKIYFPRLLMPLASVAAKLVDFCFAAVFLVVLLASYGVAPNSGVFVLPLLFVLMVAAAAGWSIWLSAMAIQYRDVKHGMTFLVQILMYATPVVYPASLIPDRYQLVYALNPMVAVIEGFRSALLGTRPMPWNLLGVGAVSAIAVGITGILYFRSRERLFADVA
jgi:lipopolysaccharide transport system permease protein